MRSPHWMEAAREMGLASALAMISFSLSLRMARPVLNSIPLPGPSNSRRLSIHRSDCVPPPTYVVSTTADSRHETRQTKTEGDKCGSGDSTSKGRKPTKRAMNQAEDERTSGVSLSCISA